MASAAPTGTSSVPLPSVNTIFEESLYHYIPTESITIVFVVLFSISLLFHVIGMIRYRLWWLLPTVILALIGEIIGWSGRLWSSINFEARDPFMIQFTCTVIAPTPFAAAIFITFGLLVQRLGVRYSWLSPLWYSRVFLSCDIISLLIQALGGGIASSSTTSSGIQLGSNIMLVGITTQMIALCTFVILAVWFFYCYFLDRPMRHILSTNDSCVSLMNQSVWNGKLKALSAAIAFIVLLLMIRAVYRTIELVGGWDGPIISTQKWFNIFDGMMIVLAVYTLNVFHPGYLLSDQPLLEYAVGHPDDNKISAEKLV